MSIIKRIQRAPQPRRRGEVDNAEAKQRKKLTLAEVGIIASFGVGGLVGLFLLAWLVLPHSSNILPFMVASALPLFTLFAIIYQAVVYRRQWNAMQASLKQTDRVIEKMDETLEEQRKLVVQNERAVKAAEDSAKHAEESLRVSQRAYVGLKMRPTIEWTEEGDHPVVTLYFTNAGHTPAQRCELVFEYGFNSSATVFQDYRMGFTIAAHVDKSIACECPNVSFRPDYSEAFFYFRGRLRYVDAWEGAQATPFHYFYNRKTLALEEFYVRNPRHDPRH
jgi:hypothetical protein